MPKTRDSFQIKFISLSLILLFLFLFNLFFVYPLIFPAAKQTRLKTADTFYLNENFNAIDPLLTAVPTLDKIITGPIITDLDPSMGPAEALINIVIYTDFTCWYCGQTMANALKVQEQFSTKVKLIHKDFPSADKTFKSYQAALAGRCAQVQDKFWQMSDLLYQNYNNLSQALLAQLASDLKLNEPQFQQCLKNDAAAALIDDDIKEANALRINGIPTVYINEQEVMGEVSYEELKQAVEKELKR